MNIRNHLNNFSLEAILNALPENKPLYKDSGSWQIRTDDMERVIFQQEIDQSFNDFIYSYVEIIYPFMPDDLKEKFQMDLASHSSNFAPFEDINNL